MYLFDLQHEFEKNYNKMKMNKAKAYRELQKKQNRLHKFWTETITPVSTSLPVNVNSTPAVGCQMTNSSRKVGESRDYSVESGYSSNVSIVIQNPLSCVILPVDLKAVELVHLVTMTLLQLFHNHDQKWSI